MRTISTYMGFFALVVSPAILEGATISSAGAGQNTVSNPGASGQINGSFDGFSADDSLRTFDLDLTALAKGTSPVAPSTNAQRYFDTNIGTATEMSGTPVDYTFSVTLTNNVGTGLEDPDQPAALGDDIQNIEFEIVQILGAAPIFVPPPTPGPAGPYLFLRGPNQVLRFGGINGGGPAIGFGLSRTFEFTLRIADVSGAFALRTTANPEPGSMALAGAVCCLFGGGYTFRRRRKIPIAEMVA